MKKVVHAATDSPCKEESKHHQERHEIHRSRLLFQLAAKLQWIAAHAAVVVILLAAAGVARRNDFFQNRCHRKLRGKSL